MSDCFGVDGCRGGWLRVGRDAEGQLVAPEVFSNASALLAALPKAARLGIDMPIGLPEEGPRDCDRELRRFLGRPRGSSVFAAPLRVHLEAEDYPAALAAGRTRDGRGLSLQSWNILPKIRELDVALAAEPKRAEFCHEVHPELAFALWSGAPIVAAKRSREGHALRRALVVAEFGEKVLREARALGPKRLVADDDILDAFAALWSTERIARAEDRRFPEKHIFDRCGRLMQIRG